MSSPLKIGLVVWAPIIIYGLVYAGMYMHAKSQLDTYNKQQAKQQSACAAKSAEISAQNAAKAKQTYEKYGFYGQPTQTVPVCYSTTSTIGHGFLYLPTYNQ